ncbi:DUF4344 domain-containing metallopeptidase [soil metagenome]
MSRNLYNLFAVIVILIIITACVCRSDRNNEPTPIDSSKLNSAENKPNLTEEVSENKKSDKGDFIVEHIEVKNPRYEEIDRQIKEDKTLEKAAAKLNRSLSLPNDIVLRTKDCGEINAFFDSDDQSVTVCYELMEHFYKLFRSSGDNDEKAYDSMFDAVRFAFLHEIGHALIYNYKLPITGNEEDAADRCSSFINLTELGDVGVRSVLAASDAFKLESKGNVPSERNLADEHLLQEQRSYNSLCMTYGSNPTKYAFIVEKGYLPQSRAERCPGEYERTAQSWGDLLEPWRKN